MGKWVVNLYSNENQQRIGNPCKKVEFNDRETAVKFGRSRTNSCKSYNFFDVEKK